MTLQSFPPGIGPWRPEVVRFGAFEVHPAAHELRRRGVRVRLSGQPFSILLTLLERPGEVISREELRGRLWPEDTFVDFEHGLNSAVKKLRRALGDSAEHPRYIETLPRVGYRFIAPVHQNGDHSPVAAPPPMPSVDSPSTPVAAGAPHRWRPLLFGAAMVVVATSALTMATFQAPSASVTGETRLTFDSRADRWGRIQTDGVRLFFLERRGHQWDLMQMPASGGAVEKFATPFANARILAISPDASEMLVGSFTLRSRALPLWLMPAVGGTPTRVADLVVTDAVFTPGGGITFSTDDGVFVARKDGTAVHRLASMQGRKEALGWSPDGRVLRFEWEDPKAKSAAIWEMDAQGGRLHRMLPEQDTSSRECCGRWTADGRYYLFKSYDHEGSQNIMALPEARGFSRLFVPRKPIPIPTGPIPMDQVLPSLDGDRLFVLGSNEHYEYVRLDPATREYRSLIGGAPAAWLSFSGDGQYVSYHNDGRLWRSRPDGSERIEIVSHSYHPRASRLSANGGEVLFLGNSDGGELGKVYVVPAEGGIPRELTSYPYEVALDDWSPDRRAVTFAVDRNAGSNAGVYLRELTTGALRKLPGSEGYWSARWSPDGAWLAAKSEDNSTLGLFDAKSQRWTELARGQVIGPPAWSSDSRYVYFQDIVEEHEPVRRVEIATGRVERVVDFQTLLEGGVQRCGFEDVGPDGSLILRLTRGDHDIYALRLALR